MASGKAYYAAKAEYGSSGQSGGKNAAAAAVNLANPAVSTPGNREGTPQLSGSGAQFVYAAATVANILTANLTQVQINLLANFLSVVTSCIYAVLAVENPTDIEQG